MSASQKKKLRNEQNSTQMTEKQITEQKEAKKLRMYTGIFFAVIAVMLCVVIVTTFVNSGYMQRHTTAATVGDSKISAAEYNHYYMDSINKFMDKWGNYLPMTGIAPDKPLEDQVYDEATGETWADYFRKTADDSILHNYALYNAAVAEDMTLSEDGSAAVEAAMQNAMMKAVMQYGTNDVDAYMNAAYGQGCTEKTYRHYVEVQVLASQYALEHMNSLTYTDEQIRAKDDENPNSYNSYSYNQFYLSASNFLEGGTKDEDGNITYSDEEKAAAAAKCGEAAKKLADPSVTTAVVLDKAITSLNLKSAGENPASTESKNVPFASIPGNLTEWVTAADRKAGDITMIANTSTYTDVEGKEVTTTNGYNIVLFNAVNDNQFAMSNVRHILVAFEGGVQDEQGQMTYTDEQKAAAKTEADEILAQFLAGETTEEAFAALATEKTDDHGSAANGGLYENIVPTSNYVPGFLNWSVDAARKPGDTGIVETEYGYHIMYYVGNTEQTYRDFTIENVLLSEDMTKWESDLAEAATLTAGNTKYVPTGLVLQAG